MIYNINKVYIIIKKLFYIYIKNLYKYVKYRIYYYL